MSVDDARHAVAGGADRLELVSAIEMGGLTPEVSTLAAVRAAVPETPVRVMLRTNAGFEARAAEIDAVVASVRRLIAEGAQAFVAGWLADGQVDARAVAALSEAVAPYPWTFHHAFDAIATAPSQAWGEVAALTGVDHVLTAGSTQGLGVGLETVCALARLGGPTLLAGGGLLPEMVPALRRAGVTAFHVGSRARPDDSWRETVSAAKVAHWRALLD